MLFNLSRRSLFALFVSCLLPTGNAQLSFSQAPTATLTGTIEDPTGAVLPNVTVTVTNTDRNTTQSARTNELGGYVIPALNPGNYSVAAELAGEEVAKSIQLVLEYDPQPPFDTGSPEKAGVERVKRIRERLAPLLESRRKANAEAAARLA